MNKNYPDYWTDLIGEISCGVSFLSKKEWKCYPEGKDRLIDENKKLMIHKNDNYIPLSKRKKDCNKKLGLDCIGCPFALISEATPKMIKHIKKFYKENKNG